MKGLGTFRRMLTAVASVIGMGSIRAAAPQAPSLIPNEVDRPQDRKKRRRSRVLKGKHTPSAKKFTVLRWGDCPAPLSRKALKRIASNHPALAL
jgi:hypothetical protein